MIDKSIRKLVCYGLEKGFFTKRDEIYVTNRIMELLELDGKKITVEVANEVFKNFCVGK